jgi:hypothetical protein
MPLRLRPKESNMSKLKTLIVLMMAVAPAVLSAEPAQPMAPGYQPTVEVQACCRVLIGGVLYCIPC